MALSFELLDLDLDLVDLDLDLLVLRLLVLRLLEWSLRCFGLFEIELGRVA